MGLRREARITQHLDFRIELRKSVVVLRAQDVCHLWCPEFLAGKKFGASALNGQFDAEARRGPPKGGFAIASFCFSKRLSRAVD